MQHSLSRECGLGYLVKIPISPLEVVPLGELCFLLFLCPGSCTNENTLLGGKGMPRWHRLEDLLLLSKCSIKQNNIYFCLYPQYRDHMVHIQKNLSG